MTTTLVIGASVKPERYSNQAVRRLKAYGENVLALGLREGDIDGIHIERDRNELEGEVVDTVTLYLNPRRQKEYYDWILAMKPRRVIFNPGAENPEFMDMLEAEGIEPIRACTLVMLSIENY